MQQRRPTAWLRDHGSRVMTAHIVEGAENAVIPSNHNDGFARDRRRDELPRFADLIGAPDQLPGFAKHIKSLTFRDARIGIPRCRDG
jgi:hypothetical protein